MLAVFLGFLYAISHVARAYSVNCQCSNTDRTFYCVDVICKGSLLPVCYIDTILYQRKRVHSLSWIALLLQVVAFSNLDT